MSAHSSREYQRAWRARNPDKVRAYRRASRFRADPDRLRARWAVADALASGKLVRPERCEECGEAPGTDALGRSLVEAHHFDHTRPLEVEWLCKWPCHAGRHRQVAA